MLIFNELKITPDNKHLIIDVSVKDEPYYNLIQVESIIIDTQDTYSNVGPSSKPVYTYTPSTTLSGEDTEVSKDSIITIPNKRVSLVLDKNDLGVSLEGNMFFVYAIAKGTPAIDTPCGMDNKTTLEVAVSLYSTYCATMQYIQEFNNRCSLPTGFIDMILRLKVLELSIKTGNYIQAIEYWNKYFNNITNSQIPTDCGCKT